MSRISKFAARDAGPSARIVGFFSHLRFNNLKLGVSEVETALTILDRINMSDPFEVRRSLKPLCVGNLDESRRFEDLFDSYWMDSGRVKQKVIPNGNVPNEKEMVSEAGDKAIDNSDSSSGTPSEPDEDTAILNDQREGELVAVEEASKMQKDLREFVTNQEIDDAMEVAIRIGKALRDKRSRRLVSSKKGQVLDFRKTIRRSLSTGEILLS